MSIEAMKQALEALWIGRDSAYLEAQQYHEAMKGYRPASHKAMDEAVAKIDKAITTLKQAIEEAEKHPARKWVGLTDEEINEINAHNKRGWLEDFARAIEAKLKGKNT